MERLPTSWKQESETKHYRENLAQALHSAKVYDGTEDNYLKLLQQLIDLEELSKNTPSMQDIEPELREITAALTFTPNHPRDIANIMDVAINSRNKALEKSLLSSAEDEKTENKREKLPPIFIVRMDGIILPTSPQGLFERKKDNPEAFEPARFQPRLQELLTILEANRVFADDLIIMLGKTNSNMIREVSYAAIRIPKLNRSLLVCDQVNEATFVIKGDVTGDDILNHTKEELEQIYGPEIKRVVRKNAETWSGELKNLLLSDEGWNGASEKKFPKPPKREKVSVREFYRESIAQQIRRQFKPEQWILMRVQERQAVKIDGHGLIAIATLFGIDNPMKSTNNHILLGQKIFGDVPVIVNSLEIDNRTPEQWAEVIKSKLTAEQWVGTHQKVRSKLKIDGHGIGALATIFGVENPNYHTPNYLRLGQKIYGDVPVIVKNLEIETRTPEQWAEVVKSKFTSEEWVKMTEDERGRIKIDGYGLGAIATVFGVENPTSNKKNHLLLGQKIFGDMVAVAAGEVPVITKTLEIKNRTPEQWAEIIKSKFTPEEWVKISDKGKEVIKIDGYGITAIASLFGVESPFLKRNNHLLLGQRIFGDVPVIVKNLEIENRTPEQWAEIIRSKFTPKEWMEVPFKERTKIKIDERGLVAIASLFGVKEPTSTNRNYLLLGQKIFGDVPAITKSLERENRTPEQWAEIIKSKFTPEEWVEMTKEDKRTINVDGYGTKALASLYGLDDSAKSVKNHLLLGQRIFGDVPVIVKRLEIENRTPEQWVEAIKSKFTAEQWVEMNLSENTKIKIDGRGLTALATLLGVEDPIDHKINHLLFGQRIFGNVPAITKSLEIENRTPEQWIEVIKSKFTAEQWVRMGNERKTINVDGYGLRAISSVLGGENPFSSIKNHFLLGQKIFGDVPAITKSLERESRTPEQWAEIIKNKFTAEQWVNMPPKERTEIVIDGYGSVAIASIFGVGSPYVKVKNHFLLGQKIYGNVPIILDALKDK